MQRQGQPGAALKRFWRYEQAARLMLAAKEMLHCKDRRRREWARCAIAELDDVLDDAWGEIALMQEEYDELSARVTATHFLFLYGWEEVAAMYGISFDKAKKLSYGGIRWLDAYRKEEEEEPDD